MGKLSTTHDPLSSFISHLYNLRARFIFSVEILTVMPSANVRSQVIAFAAITVALSTASGTETLENR